MSNHTSHPVSVPTQQWVTEYFKNAGAPTDATWHLEKLKGDGSTRLFFRLHHPSTTLILLWDKDWKYSQHYAAHQSFFEKLQLPVPRFVSCDAALGVLLMEDLGDELVQQRLEQEEGGPRLRTLESAIELLAHFHGKTYPVPPELPGSSYAMDGKKFNEELLYTQSHLAETFLGNGKLTDTQLGVVENFCTRIGAIKPWALSHRDYHCRNLMWKEGRLYLIDFQDSRLGHPAYDVASLLYDAYVTMNFSEREHLIHFYQQKLQNYPLFQQIEWSHFKTTVEMMGIQRTLKAAGSFASFFNRHQKTMHLKYLIPVLQTSLELIEKSGQGAENLLKVFDVPLWMSQIQAMEKKDWSL